MADTPEIKQQPNTTPAGHQQPGAVQGPISFLDAVNTRYGQLDHTDYGKNAFDLGAPAKKRGFKTKKWEMVGMEEIAEKQKNHSRLRQLVLCECGIEVAEKEKGEILAEQMFNVRDLDLSENEKFTSFEDIHYVCTQLPRVCTLQLNRIVLTPRASPLATSEPFKLMNKLILNYCGVSQFSALKDLRMPQLDDLHLEGCGIQSLCTGGHSFSFPNCKKVNLSDNNLNSWATQSPSSSSATDASADPRHLGEILLAVFPAMEVLKLSSNKLPAFDIHHAETKSMNLEFIKNLNSLALADNDDWSVPTSLHALHPLGVKLTWLHISSTKIFKPLGEIQSRLMVIGSIPQLLHLNLATVRPVEKLDADFFYVQRAFSLEQNDKERKVKYPRSEGLKSQFGDSILGGTEASGGSVHVMVPIKFRCDGFQDVLKTIPSTTTIEKVKLLISTFFKGVAPAKQTLAFITGDTEAVVAPTPLDEDANPLVYYGIGKNSIVLVKVPEA